MNALAKANTVPKVALFKRVFLLDGKKERLVKNRSACKTATTILLHSCKGIDREY